MTNQYSYTEDFAGKIPEVSHKKTAVPNISSAARVYMMSKAHNESVARVYRSGNDNGQKYMTGEDFVAYFRNRESVKEKTVRYVNSTAVRNEEIKTRPMGTVNADAEPGRIIRSASGKMPTRETVARTKTAAPNISKVIKIEKNAKRDVRLENDVKVYRPKTKKASFETRTFKRVNSENIERIKNIANDWMPPEDIVKAKPAKRDRRFGRIFLGMAGVAVSLMLIVTGSVMLSDATRDVKQLQNELIGLQAEENVLRMELDMKNDVNLLRERAVSELGMISKEYVEANYLEVGGVDSIKTYDNTSDDEGVGFSTILSAFGIN